MVKIATVAAGLGILTGLLTVAAWFLGATPYSSLWGTIALTLAVILVLDSLVALVAPKRVFYASALLSVLLGGSVWLGSGSDATIVTLLTLVLTGVTFVLSVLAARFEPKVSEQSNPMNLPVFG